MDEETRLVPTQVLNALQNAGTLALTPVGVHELATKVVAALDIIAAIIPDLRTPHPKTAKKVRGGRTVRREAIISIVAMVEASPGLQQMKLLNIERAHEIIEKDNAFQVLDERLEKLRKQVRYTVEARWAELVSEAMDAYHMAKQLAKDPRYADLAAHIAVIKSHLAKGKKKKKDPETEQASAES